MSFLFICTSYLLVGILLVFLFTLRRSLRIYLGREKAMRASENIMKASPPKDVSKCYIYSTRVGLWPLLETSATRNEFRRLITERIKEGVAVKRIWEINSLDDVTKLESYLNLYQPYSNISINYFFGSKIMIPGLLSVYGKVASISLPLPNNPNSMVNTFHFRGKPEIFCIEKYFEILWESSTAIKTSTGVDYPELEKLKERYV